MAHENLKPPSAAAVLGHAVEAFSDTLKAGVKFQESVTLWWTNAIEPLGPTRAWNSLTRSVIHGIKTTPAAARGIAAPVEEVAMVSARATGEAVRQKVHAIEAAATGHSAPHGHASARRSPARGGKKKGTASGH